MRNPSLMLTLYRFPAAVSDFRQSLALKESLFPEEDEQIAEAHYKLSLALEFASITQTESDDKKPNTGADNLDEEMRAEAVKELELAIKSTKLKLHNQEVELAETQIAEDNDVTRHRIADVKSIVADMELRVRFTSFSLIFLPRLPLLSELFY